MNILHDPVSPKLDLNMQGIDTTEAKTFADVIRILLEKRKSNPGNSEGESWAERQGTSINLPLRSAIVQQISLTEDEILEIRRESTQALTEYKNTQLQAGKMTVNTLNTEKEIEDWMAPRIMKALQKKVETATKELLGDIPLIGFHLEEEVKRILEGKILSIDFEERQRVVEPESELALAA